jgi:hypothetical protein
MIAKLIINAKEGAKIQFAIIFFTSSIFTVFIPLDIPTPLIPPMMQYVVEIGIPRKVKNNTQMPAPN